MNPTPSRQRSRARRPGLLAGVLCLAAAGCAPAMQTSGAPQPSSQGGPDPRVGLRAGWTDAGEAIRNLQLVSHTPRPQGFFNPGDMGDFGFANSDLAFQGNYLFQGNYNGVQIYDISDRARPRLVTALVCPGGQGDVSVYENLLFMSVEETRGRMDCGTQGVAQPVSAERFQGVRIFDISNIDRPRQVAAVQTCRGSHTHTLVTDPDARDQVYIYVQGTSESRAAAELAGCMGDAPVSDPNNPYFRIEVIRVPLMYPEQAQIVNMPRIFADAQTGDVAGLWPGGAQGPGTQQTAQTNQCHDITAYPEIGLAGGACSGNGILLDISDPANPRRIDEVFDPNFAYWHSATFDNEGTSVVFTDEWGGGTQARCRTSDRPEWGANAIFRLNDRELEFADYYKLPAPQTATENCVAHNGNLIPVPGRDIMVQAWYQGGISIFDFTDPENPFEIAFFDRGPMSATELTLGGYWSSYWYNGAIYGSEIGRGLDVFRLTPSEHLTQNEIDAAEAVQVERDNPQHQQRIRWPASVAVSRALLDQLERGGGLAAGRIEAVRAELVRLEALPAGEAKRAAFARLAEQVEAEVPAAADARRAGMLAESLRRLASAQT